MAIISNDEVIKIRNSANILDIVKSYGIDLVKEGSDNYFAFCPFHKEKNKGSFCVSEKKQIFKCFGCGEAGNVFSFVEKIQNVSFIEAVNIVAEKIGYNLKINAKYTPKISPYQKIYDMLTLANKYFVNNINSKDGKNALNYLIKERGLSIDTIKEFEIGVSFNDNNLNKFLINKGYLEQDLIDYCLANSYENGLVDFFRNRITFPIKDEDGHIVAYSARIYNGEDTSKYINSKESKIFKKGKILFNYDKARREVYKYGSLIICEGQMDAIRIYSSGLKNVCATMGTALTTDHIKLLKKLNAKIILVMDNDEAGAKSTLDNGEELVKNDIDVLVVRLYGEKDPDSYILKNGIEAFEDNLKNATSYFDFKIDYLKKNKDLNNDVDLSEYINSVISELNKSDDDLLKEITINRLSNTYNIDKKLLLSRLVKKDKRKITVVNQNKDKIKTNKYDKVSEAILYLMINDSKYIKRYERELNYLPDKTYRNIANDILAFKKLYGTFNIADFLTYVAEYPYYDKICEIINKNDDVELLAIDFDNFLSIIRTWIKEKQINELKEEMKSTSDIKEELNDLIIKLKKGVDE